jgi:hypothetical protein
MKLKLSINKERKKDIVNHLIDQGVPIKHCYPGTSIFTERRYRPLNIPKVIEDHNYAIVTGEHAFSYKKHLVAVRFNSLVHYEEWSKQAGKVYRETFTIKRVGGITAFFFALHPLSYEGYGIEVMGSGEAILGPECYITAPSGEVVDVVKLVSEKVFSWSRSPGGDLPEVQLIKGPEQFRMLEPKQG